MTKEKKNLLAISTLIQMIFTFFEIFFSIYVYDISKNLNIIICYTIINAFVFCLGVLILYKFLSKKVLSNLYKLSFLMGLICIALTFTINTDRIYMIFITQALLKITHIFYYLPHEVATMNTNNKSQMGKFLGISSTLSLISGFLSPFISGFIIDYASYYIIFSILIVLAIICFILSFNVKIIKEDTSKYGLKNFIYQSHKIKGVKTGYIAHLFYKLSSDGLATSFLALLIFLKTGTNFSVGLYSALASIVSGFALIIYCYYSKNKKRAMIINTILQVAVSFSIIIFNSIVVFFIYYFIKKITSKIISNGTNSTIFSIVHNTELEQCKIENFYVYNFYHHIGTVIACLIGLVIYNVINSIISITILLAILSLAQVVSTILLNKSDKLLAENTSL